MGWWFGHLLAGWAWANPCAPVGPAVEAAVSAVVSVDFAAADRAVAEATAGAGCGPALSPDAIARLWLVSGAVRSFQGRADEARAAFAAARAVAPDVWIDRLGEPLRAQWAAASPAGLADITLAGIPTGWVVTVDGGPPPTGRWRAGPHLVQAGPPGADVQLARHLDVFAEEAQVIQLVAGEAGTVAVAPASSAEDRAPQGPIAAIALGVTDAAGPLGFGPVGRMEIGWWIGRVSVAAELGGTSAGARGTGDLPEPFSYTARITAARAGVGAAFRLGDLGEPIAPEFGLAGAVQWSLARSSATAGAAASAPIGETAIRPAITGRVGVVAGAGAWEFPVSVVVDATPLGGVVTGDGWWVSYGLTVGARRWWSRS